MEEYVNYIKARCGKQGIVTLTDVMQVLRTNGGYAIDSDGLFITIESNHTFGWEPIKGYDLLPCWNIYDDNLEKQSESVIGFIYEKLL